MQKEDDSEDLRPISFYSKLLTSAEVNYSTILREALAIFSVLEVNKSWLLGQQIHVFSEHRPLKYIFVVTRMLGVWFAGDICYRSLIPHYTISQGRKMLWRIT